MKKPVLFTIFGALLIVIAYPSLSSAQWIFQVFTGTAHNFSSQLKIEQSGEEDINLTAEYETRAWETVAPYYDMRIGKWFDNHAWEFETHHHKLYLSNEPSEVDKFAISHGYNLNTINYAIRGKQFIYRLGAGIVMTHPETSVRGKKYEDDGGLNGFYISGVTSQLAIEKRFPFLKKLFLSLEAKLTASYAQIPISDGTASVPNYAVHGLVGIGYVF